jgi:hypothetical protein
MNIHLFDKLLEKIFEWAKHIKETFKQLVDLMS